MTRQIRLGVFTVAGCGSRQTVVIPTATIGAIPESEVKQMGGFGAGLKTNTAPAAK